VGFSEGRDTKTIRTSCKPALEPYQFAMLQKKLVTANPNDRKIADVIAR
jgi:hypothetical protein